MSFLVQPTSVLTYGEHLELRQSSALSIINVKGGVELFGGAISVTPGSTNFSVGI